MFEVYGQKDYCAFLKEHERLKDERAKLGHHHSPIRTRNLAAVERNLVALERAMNMNRYVLWEMFFNQPWDNKEAPDADNVARGISLSHICDRR